MRRIAAAVAFAALVAGCGSSRSAPATTAMTAKSAVQRAYEQRMATIAPALQSRIFKLRLALEQSKSPYVARGKLRNLDALLDRRIGQLKALTPPQDVAADHAKLIAAYRMLRTEFDQALRPLLGHRTTDAARVTAGRLSRAPAFRSIGNALHAIIAKGYDLGFPPGS